MNIRPKKADAIETPERIAEREERLSKFIRSTRCPAAITEMARRVSLSDEEREFLAEKRDDFNLLADTLLATKKLRGAEGEAVDLQEAWDGRKAAERQAADLRRQLDQLRLSIEAKAREEGRDKVLASGAQAISSGND